MADGSPKRVENTVGKGEIARYEQFLLFPQCFRKTCTADTEKPGLVWERVNTQTQSMGGGLVERGVGKRSCTYTHRIRRLILTLSQTSPGFYTSAVQVF